MLQIAEETPRLKHREDFLIQRELALVVQVMNGKTGQDYVELPSYRVREHSDCDRRL